jgi:hypothetical protein
MNSGINSSYFNIEFKKLEQHRISIFGIRSATSLVNVIPTSVIERKGLTLCFLFCSAKPQSERAIKCKQKSKVEKNSHLTHTNILHLLFVIASCLYSTFVYSSSSGKLIMSNTWNSFHSFIGAKLSAKNDNN